MRLVGDSLFSKRQLRNLRNKKLADMSGELLALDGGQVLNTDSEELVKYFTEKYDIDVPVIDVSRIEIDNVETDLEPHAYRSGYFEGFSPPPRIRGTIVQYHIPYSGDGDLFDYMPNTYSGGPTATIMQQELIIGIEFAEKDADSKKVEEKFERELGKLEKYLKWQRNDVSQFREELQSRARTQLDSRKKKLLADQEILVKIERPIRRPNAPTTYRIPEVRKKIELPKQRREAASRVQEQVLPTADYEDILKILEGMVEVMELSPRAFSDLDEEALRFHFLVPLNVQYKGDTTAETFNYTGKTDIIIRSEGKSLFVAECKVWHGPKTLKDTIDQILRYLTWRDTKAAILLFNRNKAFSKVLEKIPGTVEEHPCCDRQLDYKSDRGFRFEMHRPDDPQGKLLLTVLAFDIPRLDESPDNAP